MLGLKDPVIFWAYLLTILSALLCVIYGILNWNKGAENEGKEMDEEKKWEKKDKEISDKL
ncbi:MAG: hypothetical protein PHV30_02715 [Candidatus Margulisbacteria bacterium]|nr:hypothetical protein [Candidatus Margulisiibacteriota bacterium]